MSDREEWKRLQKKIFGRWIHQKVFPRTGLVVNDILEDLKSATLFRTLLEVLSETRVDEKKWNKKDNLPIQKIANFNLCLDLAYAVGVQPPGGTKINAEDFLKGDEKNIMGLTWQIMQRFIKFDEGDEGLDATQALLMWVKNKCMDYPQITVTDQFKSTFKNGLALCALIHKHRPMLIENMHSLTAENPEVNFRIAVEAAQRYFGLERYIEPEDIPKLDEKSMFIYVSEFYYGIAEQRKLDAAARRISKLISKTIENDALKADFNAKAKEFKTRVADVQVTLSDVMIDDTLAGAQKRIDEFYVYKLEKKSDILRLQLELERLFTNIQTRLTQMKRPPFRPFEGLTLNDINNTVKQLEQSELERNVKLHAELNRQIDLRNLDGQHKERFDKLEHFYNEKKKYLDFREKINSSSEALKQLQILESCRNEIQHINNSAVADLVNRGDLLRSERFEFKNDVTNRENQIKSYFAKLNQLHDEKKPVLEDDLAREKYKEETYLRVREHELLGDNIISWYKIKEQDLEHRENVESSAIGTTLLNELATYEKEKENILKSHSEPLKDLGKFIIARAYHHLSHWEFPESTVIHAREKDTDDKFSNLNKLSAEKKKFLEDALQRELYKEETFRLLDDHEASYIKFTNNWFPAKQQYLTHKEDINDLPAAQAAYNTICTYERENGRTIVSSVNPLKKLGQKIKDRAYNGLTQWTFPKSATVNEREGDVDAKLADLKILCQKKKEILNDDVEREKYKEATYLLVNEHKQVNTDFDSWHNDKKTYLTTKEAIDNLPAALTELNKLSTYVRENKRTIKTTVASLKELGKTINARGYHVLSHWDFPDSHDINSREQDVDAKLSELSSLCAKKKEILDDDEERERYKEATFLLNNEHNLSHVQFNNWYNNKKDYLTRKEIINTLPEAISQLNTLDSYERENERTVKTTVVSLKDLGKTTNARAYNKLSTWRFPNSNDVNSREQDVDAKLVQLQELCQLKRRDLLNDKKREEEKERLRLKFADQATSFKAWESDVISNAEVTQFVGTLREVENFKNELDREDGIINSNGKLYTSQYEDTDKELKSYNVTDNVYTSYSTSDLAKARLNVESALGKRRERYEATLATERYNDQLCQKFAGLIVPLSQFINSGKDTITTSTASLEEQLDYINKKLASREEDGKQLAPIKEVYKEMTDRKITHNEHTSLTVKDIEVQWDQYKSFLENKKKQIEEEIENAKLRGLTPSDLRDIEDNFNAYDKNHNGILEMNELKACLYSLGEEKSKSQVEEILKTFGDGKQLNYNQFKEMMIRVLGDADTKEEVLFGFRLINRLPETGPTVAVREKLSQVMTPEDIEYIFRTAPAQGDGVNYASWTEDIFSR